MFPVFDASPVFIKINARYEETALNASFAVWTQLVKHILRIPQKPQSVLVPP